MQPCTMSVGRRALPGEQARSPPLSLLHYKYPLCPLLSILLQPPFALPLATVTRSSLAAALACARGLTGVSLALHAGTARRGNAVYNRLGWARTHKAPLRDYLKWSPGNFGTLWCWPPWCTGLTSGGPGGTAARLALGWQAAAMLFDARGGCGRLFCNCDGLLRLGQRVPARLTL